MYITGNFGFYLQIQTKDADGIEEVILIHSFDDGPWSNLSMNERSEDSEWYEVDLEFPSFELYETHSVDVIYTAMDTLGN
jgi:hypothetical protein